MPNQDTQVDIRELQKRRAVVFFGEDELRKRLKIPDDVYLRGINYDPMRQVFEIHLFGNRFEEIHDECESPWVPSEVFVEECEHGMRHIVVQFPEGTKE